MPEGPEIRRAADALADAVQGRVAEQVWFGLPGLKCHEMQLSGRQIKGVETRGKAMLTRFDGGLNIYSHNQLYGRWLIMPAGQRPETNRQLRLAIDNSEHSALLYSASDIMVLNDAELLQHPFLRKLGPDPLQDKLSVKQIEARLSLPQFRRRQLGALLTDQSFIAGIGNYLRCEILFVAGLAPNITMLICGSAQLKRLAEVIDRLIWQSYKTAGITNELKRTEKMMAEGATFEQARFHLFRRAGLPCYVCGTIIVKIKMNSQPTYLCPQCQGVLANAQTSIR
ncbi:MAG: endonuclease VIII [Candidatus Polarisedimenticolaceae bacterium]|nr:endonuclease VIII [Candidatus Polarisedimenticolaceae bacterium]